MIFLIIFIIIIIIIIITYLIQQNNLKLKKTNLFFVSLIPFILINLFFLFFQINNNFIKALTKNYDADKIKFLLKDYPDLIEIFENGNETNKYYFQVKFFDEKTKISKNQLIEEINLLEQNLNDLLKIAEKKPQYLQNNYFFLLKKNNMFDQYENYLTNLDNLEYYDLLYIYVHEAALLSITKNVFNI